MTTSGPAIPTAGVPRLHLLDPLEVAAGWVFGAAEEPLGAPCARRPRAVLEDLMLEALRRPPCVVAFSGGRDSSAVLAVATDVARRHGFQDPIPVTRRYPGHPGADEVQWQTAVVDHLALEDWVRIDVHGECDLVGPLAAQVLRRYGLVWPFASYTNVPVFRTARGGAVLTGEGGDNVFGPQRASIARHLLGGSMRQRARALRLLPTLAGPRAVRRSMHRRRIARDGAGWLRPDAWDLVVQRLADDEARQPLRWARAVRGEPFRRSWQAGKATIRAIARDHDVHVSHPLFDDAFLAGLAATCHPFGPMSRTEIMTELFGDLLPRAVLSRRTKAMFNSTVVGDASHRFVEQWRGDGLDEQIVDVDQLRREWRSARPHAGTFGLLQQAWLAAA